MLYNVSNTLTATFPQEINMTNKKPGKVLVPPSNGMLRNFVARLKLIARLMGDRRISIFLKVIPIGALLYLISPVDLLPGMVFPVIGALDDAAVLWIGSRTGGLTTRSNRTR